jgi:hypothetical protein
VGPRSGLEVQNSADGRMTGSKMKAEHPAVDSASLARELVEQLRLGTFQVTGPEQKDLDARLVTKNELAIKYKLKALALTQAMSMGKQSDASGTKYAGHASSALYYFGKKRLMELAQSDPEAYAAQLVPDASGEKREPEVLISTEWTFLKATIEQEMGTKNSKHGPLDEHMRDPAEARMNKEAKKQKSEKQKPAKPWGDRITANAHDMACAFKKFHPSIDAHLAWLAQQMGRAA